MGRERRIEFNGAIYHVIQRGNNREYIFNEEIDKGYFIKLIKEAKEGLGFKIYAYILMDNHYHFLMQTFGKPLSKIMHQINNSYSKYYNYKYGHCGHVFQGRYGGFIVQDVSYLMSVVKYIHQNPVKANICKYVRQYKWSSDIFYRRNINGFVDIDVVLDMISTDRKQAIKSYNASMLKIEETDYDNEKIIGDDAYKVLMNVKKTVKVRKPLDQILLDTGVSPADYALIKQGSRKRHLIEYKKAYIKAAYELKYTMEEIARNINLSDTAIYNLLRLK